MKREGMSLETENEDELGGSKKKIKNQWNKRECNRKTETKLLILF